MSVPKSIRAGACVAALVGALSACSNDPAQLEQINVIRAGFASLFAGDQPPQGVPDPARMLATTAQPLILVVNEETRQSSYLVEIERNGAYQSFATSQRRVFVLSEGMVTATRGLGNDLMSADLATATAVVRSRQAGEASRVMRFLDGEWQTVSRRFECSVTLGDTVRVTFGEVDTSAVSVVEACTGDGVSFSNLYAVSPGGDIVQSRQWLGDGLGYVQIQQVRQ